MGKRTPIRERAAKAAVSIIAATGAGNAHPAAEATPFHEMTAIEQTATAVTDVGKAADDASSADDVAKIVEAIDDQLTSGADVHESPEANPEGGDPQKVLLDLKADQEEKKKKKADEDLALGDREEVSGGNITAPAPPAGGESAVTGREQAQGAAPADEEQSRAAAGADQQRAEAAAGADQQRAEAAARADDESYQQAAAEDEERFGHPTQESEPADETWPEDDADVDDPDID